jgi:hypothetical protein
MLAARRALDRRVRTLALIAVLFACSARPAVAPPPQQRAFYFWRTTFTLSDSERRAITELGVTRLYVRMFDVAWNEQDHRAQPLGAIEPRDPPPAGVELVPVVFIRNEVLRHAAPADLARDIWATAQRHAAALGFQPRELQLDCDWSEQTRDAYFALVRDLRAESQLAMSSTIRLHQVKYPERTGVPPADRVTLMFYNMGRFSADPDARAIFDANAAASYLARLGDYPLPLDVALPIWSWTVQVRDGAVIDLLQSADPSELAAADFLTHTAEGYVATRATFLHGTFLRAGDVLKPETTGRDETLTAAHLLATRLPPAARTVALFDLSDRNLARHDPTSLDQVFHAVR